MISTSAVLLILTFALKTSVQRVQRRDGEDD